ncbi:hypothetical protein AYL99_04201 [Fonsecaea erecta]|uniref:Vps72/YL1 C-terminal domain-containing protein n=1 Tax=Fonsecaea erecta TaxID=1367422 RepID=A0A178ZQ86_9EURO|nr:hypothetical protein AYL99_04201 [Fonsecaea erecta]OAP61998.1 hypothetical protein AYL99_04201 [Fonsecaea erecta]
MADETNDDTPQLSATESSEDESADELVETLVAGRERRKTAGNRYDRDKVLEEAKDVDDQDEVTLLFAGDEDEDDEEFRSDDEDHDADMSSSDDEDQGPNAEADDLEGEKEIQKQAKEERAKKRKADLALTSVVGMRKKLKTDPTRPTVASVAPKPSKKKERVTWVHDQDSGRSSLRKQTIAHRAETIARLKESEAQSKKLKALKEQREKEKARDAPRELTQADRLAEAARVERQNSKSLNRWEATEKKRQEELAAKLAALKDRKLEGPVVTWLSAKAKWIGPRLDKIGTRNVTDLGERGTEPKKRGRKSKAYLEQLAAEKSANAEGAGAVQTTTAETAKAPIPLSSQSNGPTRETATATATTPITTTVAALVSEGANPPIMPTAPQEAPQEHEDTFLRQIHEYAEMQMDSNPTESGRVSPISQDVTQQQAPAMRPDTQQSAIASAQNTTSHLLKVPKPSSEASEIVAIKPEAQTQPTHTPEPSILPEQTQVHPPTEAAGRTQPSINAEQGEQMQPSGAIDQTQQTQPAKVIEKSELTENSGAVTQPEHTSVAGAIAPPAAPEPPLVEEYSTRNLVILEKFEELSSEARQEFSLFYNNRKTAKPVKHIPELCSITMLPVRYRDQKTGIGFANAGAYKKLQELKEHKFVWSSMLGCYVGREGGPVARGVPEGWG